MISFQVINFDSPRGGISLVTEKGPETTSRLMIQKAVPSDSGIYTCEPSNANPSSIKVHVVNGELKIRGIAAIYVYTSHITTKHSRFVESLFSRCYALFFLFSVFFCFSFFCFLFFVRFFPHSLSAREALFLFFIFYF